MFVAGVVGLTACSSPRVAAVVDGTKISRSSVNSEADELLRNQQYLDALNEAVPSPEGPTAPARDGMVARVVTRRIYLAVVFQEVRRRNLSISVGDERAARLRIINELGHDPESGQADADRGEAVFLTFSDDYQRTLIEREASVVRLTRDLAGTAVDDAAIAAYYDRQVDDYTEVCGRHALFATRDQADDARARLSAGADFAALAIAESVDEVTAHLGGDIGCSSPKGYPRPFAEAMRTVPVGVVSEPIETVLGFHLLEVFRRTIQTLDEVRSDIEALLLAAQDRTFKDWLERAVRDAVIEVDPAVGRLDTSPPIPLVVPAA